MQRIFLTSLLYAISQISHALPEGFVYLHDIAPSIIEEMRYAGSNNFIGKPIPGYLANRCILTRSAAEHLAHAQSAAQKMGYSFKVYDCYRPQTAVNAFYQWSLNPADTAQKATFYAREKKSNLFPKGYIAQESGHSRGSTVDLTLVKLSAKNHSVGNITTLCYGEKPNYRDDNSLDMGTRFDCFDVHSHVFYKKLTPDQSTNRLLLRYLMQNNGFKPYENEWWHFTLDKEPYPNTYFDFYVQ